MAEAFTKAQEARSRIGELLSLLARMLWWIVASVILGIVGVVEAVQGAHKSAYLFCIAGLLLFCVACLVTAYRALSARDAARGAGTEVGGGVTVHNHYYEGESGPTFVGPEAKAQASGSDPESEA